MKAKVYSAITAVNSVTPVGFDAFSTAAAVRAGISALEESDRFTDMFGEPVTVAEVPDFPGSKCTRGIAYERAEALAVYCLGPLFESLKQREPPLKKIDLHIGLQIPERCCGSGPDESGIEMFKRGVVAFAADRSMDISIRLYCRGNPSAIEALNAASEQIARDPQRVAVVGAVDSLVTVGVIGWFEKQERLKSKTFGRHQGIPPGEAAAFFVLEDRNVAQSRKCNTLAYIAGSGWHREEAFFLSPKPSLGQGLTKACKQALNDAHVVPEQIDTVLGDLNGEYYRSREWSLAEIRCFGGIEKQRVLWHPADCIGDVGAASAAVLINLCAVWGPKSVAGPRSLIFSYDDFGWCGSAVILDPTVAQHERR